jgi:hypothetical protein
MAYPNLLEWVQTQGQWIKESPLDVIDFNNQWQKTERAGSMKPSLSMREHYTDVQLALNQLL